MSQPNPDIRFVKSKKPSYILPWNNGNWGPEGWYRYKVRFGDNWWSVASKDGWSDPMDLIEYNFKTRKPKEVNWYLRNFVGCTHATEDGFNHVFTDNLSPGYIYTVHKLREQPAPIPARVPWPDVPPPEDKDLVRPGVWLGVGVKGGLFAGVGYDRTEAVMFSADFSDIYTMNIDTLKFGGGAGVGGGVVLVIASGLPNLRELKHCVIGGMDWNLSMGVKLKALGKTAAGLGSLARLAQSIRAGERNWQMLSNGAAGLKYIAGLTDSMNFGNMPAVTLVEIPFASLGLEISMYSARSTFGVQTLYESDSSLIGIPA